MKKLLLATIIAIVFISGTIVGAIPFATAVGGGVQPERPIIKQLNAIGKILEKVDQRLERILGHIGPPQDPETIVALTKIKAEASSIVAQATSKLEGTVPPPPTDTG